MGNKWEISGHKISGATGDQPAAPREVQRVRDHTIARFDIILTYFC